MFIQQELIKVKTLNIASKNRINAFLLNFRQKLYNGFHKIKPKTRIMAAENSDLPGINWQKKKKKKSVTL